MGPARRPWDVAKSITDPECLIKITDFIWSNAAGEAEHAHGTSRGISWSAMASPEHAAKELSTIGEQHDTDNKLTRPELFS